LCFIYIFQLFRTLAFWAKFFRATRGGRSNLWLRWSSLGRALRRPPSIGVPSTTIRVDCAVLAWRPKGSSRGIEYFAADVTHESQGHQKKVYRIIWILEGEVFQILGVVNAYRRKTRKKPHQKAAQVQVMTNSYVADWGRCMSATRLCSLRNRHSPMDYILHEQRKIGSKVQSTARGRIRPSGVLLKTLWYHNCCVENVTFVPVAAPT